MPKLERAVFRDETIFKRSAHVDHPAGRGHELPSRPTDRIAQKNSCRFNRGSFLMRRRAAPIQFGLGGNSAKVDARRSSTVRLQLAVLLSLATRRREPHVACSLNRRAGRRSSNAIYQRRHFSCNTEQALRMDFHQYCRATRIPRRRRLASPSSRGSSGHLVWNSLASCSVAGAGPIPKVTDKICFRRR